LTRLSKGVSFPVQTSPKLMSNDVVRFEQVEFKGYDKNMEYKSGCLICGGNLIYSDAEMKQICSICGHAFNTNGYCVNSHFVCDRCHSSSAIEYIEKYCISTKMTDPIELAQTLMQSPTIKMHGPEHHFLVPAVLLTSYYNYQKDYEKKKAKLNIAKGRAEKILGGFCGSHGNCGAGVGTGISVSIITSSTPLSRDGWRLSNLMTAKSLFSIANRGGPRCCKRDSFLAIIEAVEFTKEHFRTPLPIKERIVCSFSHLNGECLHEDCKFYEQ